MAKAAMRMKGNFLESFASGRSARAPVSSERDDLLSLLRDGGRQDADGGEDASNDGYADPLEREARADLLATIHEQIIPQLVLAHTSEPGAGTSCPDARLPPTPGEVEALCCLAVEQDLLASLAIIEAMVGDGLTIETVLLELIAPAARKLGDDWLEDLRTFTEVTVGLGTLQEVIHILGPSFAHGIVHRGAVVLVPAPNEQHTLGVHLLGEFLRRAGWGVLVDPRMSRAELLLHVEAERIEMVGISVSNSDLVDTLERLVRDIKRASLNADIAVMIGGSLNLEEHAARLGVTFCNDPREAVRWLEHHVSFPGRPKPN